MKRYFWLLAFAATVVVLVAWNRAERVACGQTAAPPSGTGLTGIRTREFVQLSGSQPPIWNQGNSHWFCEKLQIHGNPADPPEIGLCLSRKWVTLPNGVRILHSVFNNAVRDIYITGKFKKFGVLVLGCEGAHLENVFVDAQCGVASWCESSIDLWGLAAQFDIHGANTHSGGTRVNCNAVNSAGGDVSAVLFVGKVTDMNWIGCITSGVGSYRFRFHTVNPYQYALPDGRMATTDGRPSANVFAGVGVAEGSFQVQFSRTRERSTYSYAADIKLDNGPPANWVPIDATRALATIGGPP